MAPASNNMQKKAWYDFKSLVDIQSDAGRTLFIAPVFILGVFYNLCCLIDRSKWSWPSRKSYGRWKSVVLRTQPCERNK